jgi:Tfp pilus assembly protein PilX
LNHFLPTTLRPKGSALLLSLILLVAFTLLGVSLASAYQLQQRVQTNQERASSAMHAANSALAEAERWLFGQTIETRPVACALACAADRPVWVQLQIPANVQQLDRAWWQTHGQSSASSAGERHWLIEELLPPGPVPDPSKAPTGYYRVVAMGSDDNGIALAVTESLVVRPWVDVPNQSPTSPGSLVNHFCGETGIDPCGRVSWRQLR